MQKIIFALVCLSALVFGKGFAQDLSVENLPASIVSTLPRCGDTAVDPENVKQLQITFSKEMTRESFSLVKVSNETFPKIDGKPGFSADGRTCVVDVKLKPNSTYVIWVNSQKYQGFRDLSGKPAIPYLLVFQTM